MITEFRPRTAVVICALCVAGVLALVPVAAAAGAEPTPPGAPRATPQPSFLYRQGTQVRAHRGVPGVPDVSALSWLVADARTGKVLAARDAHRKLPPASTLKTLFAVTALPHLRAEDRHTVSEQDLAGIGAGQQPGGGRGRAHLPGRRPVARSLPQLRQRRRARAGLAERRLGGDRGPDAGPGPLRSAPSTPRSSRPTATTPRARSPRRSTSRCSAGRACATRTSPSTARPPSAQFPGGGGSYGIVNTNRLLSGSDGVARTRGSSASRTATPATRATPWSRRPGGASAPCWSPS